MQLVWSALLRSHPKLKQFVSALRRYMNTQPFPPAQEGARRSFLFGTNYRTGSDEEEHKAARHLVELSPSKNLLQKLVTCTRLRCVSFQFGFIM